MRSKLGTQSRLAAHILAFVLLILMLVYTSPETQQPEEQRPRRLKPSVSVSQAKDVPQEKAAPSGVGTLDRVQTPAVATRVEKDNLRPPADPAAPRQERPAAAAPGIALRPPAHSGTLDTASSLRPHAEPLRPPVAETAQPVAEPAPDSVIETTILDNNAPAGDEVTGLVPEQAPAAGDMPEAIPAEESNEPGVREEPPAPPSETAQPVPAAAIEDAAETRADALETEPPPEEAVPSDQTPAAPEPENDESQPPLPQPDESGSLVVAASETGVVKPIAAATPLPNANLEVLGDGVYWLDPRHDLETELSTIPELRSLILLVPLPGFLAQGFEHVKTETIPADPADLTADAAERFIHLTEGSNRPVVVAVQPGTRGAAFFKGAYLMHNRNMSEEDMLREIAPELDDAGAARDDIVHRLMRLKN